MRLRATCIVLILVSLAAGQSAQASAVFQGVGDLSGGGVRSNALGISPDGLAVVGSSWSSKSTSQAYRWLNGTLLALAIPSNTLMQGNAASEGGRVIVGRMSAIGSDYGEAFAWENGHVTNLGFIGGGPAFDSSALGVTRSGSRIVGWSTNGAGGTEAFRRDWPTGAMTGLGLGPGQNSSSSMSISFNGVLMAGTMGDSDGFNQAARIDASGGFTVLEDLAGGQETSRSVAISADGSTIVGQGRSDAGFEAVRWTSDLHVHALGAAQAGLSFSAALGTSGNGAFIVGEASGQGRGVAFLWNEIQGFRSLETVLGSDYGLNTTGWMLTSARGISEDGQVIVGDGINPSGNQEGWIAILENSPRLTATETQVSWIQPYHPNGTRWDVVRGGLSSLRATGGDFQQSTLGCLSNNTSNMAVNSAAPPPAGDGFWFLARQDGGSYDLPYGNQVGSRDSEIAASGHGCQ